MKNVLKTTLIFLPLIFLHSAGYAHYQWLIAGPGGKDSLRIRIGSGHHFPVSDMLVRKEMIREIRIPGGGARAVELKKSGREWNGLLRDLAPETGVIEFTVRRRGGGSPLFTGKCVLKGAAARDISGKGITGEGVEIFPESIQREKGVYRIRLKVVREGQPVAARVTVIPEKGRPLYLSADAESGCIAELKREGWVLAAVHLRGGGASVTFYIGE